MKIFNEQEGARNGSPYVEIVVYGLIIFVVVWRHGTVAFSEIANNSGGLFFNDISLITTVVWELAIASLALIA